ncbi:MAG: hypothetical protein ACSLFQ_12075 [Thermoanaerobaculia bacterium]
MRFVLEALAGTIGGLVGWFVVGFLAAQIFTSIGGSREGANAMGGFFFFGPLGGIAGFAFAFWIARRYLERGADAAPSSNVFVETLVALVLVVGLGSVVLFGVARLMRPESTVNIAQGEEAAIEFEIRVPNAALGGRRASEVITLSFQAFEGHDERSEPVPWSEAAERGGVTLTGRVVIRERTREQYFVIGREDETFKLYADIPENMYRKGSWQPRHYLSNDASMQPGDTISATCRYVPPER